MTQPTDPNQKKRIPAAEATENPWWKAHPAVGGCGTPHTDQTDDVPSGYRIVASARVYVDDAGTIVVTAEPEEVWPDYDEDHPHNCDAAGCNVEHVVAVVEAPDAG